MAETEQPEEDWVIKCDLDIDDFILSRKVGEGQFGSVYAGSFKKTGRKVAMKFIKIKDHIQKDDDQKKVDQKKLTTLVDECRITRALEHKNIVRSYGAMIKGPYCVIVTELAKFTLADYKKHKQRIGPLQTAHFMAQAIEAIVFMHSQMIWHRDLKLENCLLYGDTLKLCDFGAAKMTFDDFRNTVCGSVHAMSPERIEGQCQYTRNADFWSIGIMTFELVTGRDPFSGKARKGMKLEEYQKKTMKRIALGRYRFPIWFDDEPTKEFIRGRLEHDKYKRVSMHKAWKCKFFEKQQESLSKCNWSIYEKHYNKYTADRLN